MSVLKGLTFTAVPRNAGLTPEQHRRAKLAAHLREQLDMAKAQTAGRIHVVKKRRWEYTEDGQKHLIEVDKRLKQWWKAQSDGKIVLTVRYGSKPLEFEKGKGAVVLKGMDELLAILPKLVDAAEAGEFDNFISAVGKPKTGVVARRAS
ncbi:DUF6641 family protein [Aestuariivirga sp.]|uniref:DUF6641 family protein n=1 Tax=Aestuariivirga sp. TaxID=2650926 RepID=UPI003BA8F862